MPWSHTPVIPGTHRQEDSRVGVILFHSGFSCLLRYLTATTPTLPHPFQVLQVSKKQRHIKAKPLWHAMWLLRHAAGFGACQVYCLSPLPQHCLFILLCAFVNVQLFWYLF